MGFLDFAGGFSNSFNSATKEAERMADRRQSLEDRKSDREYLSGQRKYNQDQQARTVRDQGREDEFQEKVSNINPTEDSVEYGDVPKTPEMPTTENSKGDGLASAPDGITGATNYAQNSSTPSSLPKVTSRQRTQPEIAMEYGKALLQKPGGFERGMEMMKHAANQTMLQANYKINELESNSGGKSLVDIANNAAKIFNSDAYSGSISGIVENPDKSISMFATNKETGQKVPITYKTSSDLFNGMRAHYSPEVFGQILNAQRASAAKISEERNKPFNLTPGEQRIIPGGPTYTNANESSAEKSARIRVGGQGMPGASGSKSGKPPLTGKDKALAAVEDKFKNDMDPSALTRVRNFVSSSYDLDPAIDDNQRVLAAEEASTNPASTRPRLVFGAQAGVAATHINSATGAKTPLYRMPAQYAPSKEDLDGFKSDVVAFVGNENAKNPGFGDLMYRAARGDQSATEVLPGFVAGRVRENWLAKNPLPATMPAAQKIKAMADLDARIKLLTPSLMKDVGQSLSLIRAYGLK